MQNGLSTRRLKEASKRLGKEGKGSCFSVAKSKSAMDEEVATGFVDREAPGILDKALIIFVRQLKLNPVEVGGATYQVPVEVDVEREPRLPCAGLLKTARARSEKTMILRLAAEMLDACDGRGASVKNS